MSKLFYDDHIDLSKVEKTIKKHVHDKEAQDELFALIDEIVHHRIIGCILDRLPREHHSEFVTHIAERPHDTGMIHYLSGRISEDVGEFLRFEAHVLTEELLNLVHNKLKISSDEK